MTNWVGGEINSSLIPRNFPVYIYRFGTKHDVNGTSIGVSPRVCYSAACHQSVKHILPDQ